MSYFRVLLCSALAAVAGVFPSTGALAQDVPVIHVAITNYDGFQVYFALDTGLFDRAGLRVEVQTLQNGPAIAAAVASNAVQVGDSNVVSLAQAHDRGLPIILVAPASLYQASAPNLQLLVLPGSPIRTPKDLNGKTLGAAVTNGLVPTAIKLMMDKNGGDSATVKYLEVPASDTLAALERGTIDAGVFLDPFLVGGRAKMRVLASPLDAFGPKSIVTSFFSTSDWATKNAKTVATFAKVLADAAIWANDPKNAARAAAIVTKYTKGPPSDTVYASVFDRAQLQPMFDAAFKYKVLASPLNSDQFIFKP